MIKNVLADGTVLHKKTEAFDFDENKMNFIEDLGDTFSYLHGMDIAAGLAAPQIGYSIAAFILRLDDSIIFCFNPQIIKGQGEIVSEEGCLSAPGKSYKIKRFKIVSAKWQNKDQSWTKRKLRDRDAIVFQHEYDHLQGKLICD